MIFIEIIPNLWIANSETLKYKDRLGIDFIVNCQKDLHFLGKYNQYKMEIGKNLEKYEIVKMYEYLNETSEFINKKLLNNNSVLVVCENGNQKSASIIAAYLMKYGKISLKNAILGMRTKHKTVFYPSIHYLNSLEMFESKYFKP